jgi:hypothetical protein
MLPKSYLLVHIAFLPLYITLAIYLNILPQNVADNLSSLLKQAKSNLRAQNIKVTISKGLHSADTNPNSTMSIKFVPRWSEERGNADHDWLKTFHTFSFAMYDRPLYLTFTIYVLTILSGTKTANTNSMVPCV